MDIHDVETRERRTLCPLMRCSVASTSDCGGQGRGARSEAVGGGVAGGPVRREDEFRAERDRGRYAGRRRVRAGGVTGDAGRADGRTMSTDEDLRVASEVSRRSGLCRLHRSGRGCARTISTSFHLRTHHARRHTRAASRNARNDTNDFPRAVRRSAVLFTSFTSSG